MARQSYYMNPAPSVFYGEMLAPKSNKNKGRNTKKQDKKKDLRFCGHNGHMLENGQLLYWNGHLVRDKKHNTRSKKLINFTSYYIEEKHNEWTPGLLCLKLNEKKANKNIIPFNKEIRHTIEQILKRENEKHYII